MSRITKAARAGLVAAAMTWMAAGPAIGATRIEGEYQLMAELRKTDRTYRWDWDSNNSDNGTFDNAQLRLFSAPRGGIEVFTRFEAEWRTGDNETPRPEFQYREAHLRFRRELGPTRGFDTYLFSRQNRFFVNTYLIPWVNGRDDAQGARLDSWGFGHLNVTMIAGDASSQFNPANSASLTPSQRDTALRVGPDRTDDFYILRLRREFLADGALRTGLTFNRFEGWSGRDSSSAPLPWQGVIGFDSRYRFRGTDFAFEYGESQPNNDLGPGGPPRSPSSSGHCRSVCPTARWRSSRSAASSWERIGRDS